MMSRMDATSRVKQVFFLVPVICLIAASTEARAGDVGFELQTGVAIPLTKPQSDIYRVGGQESLKLRLGVAPWLDLGPSASFTMLPATKELGEAGVAWGFGAGFRVKRPHDALGAAGLSPWLDADALYVRTGALNRPGFGVGVGLSLPVGKYRTAWIGPFARYSHVLQYERAGYDNRDAKLLTLGVSLEFGPGIERVAPAPAPVVTTVINEVAVCPDGDKDGVPDLVDRCLEVAGTLDGYGCPNYAKVVVRQDKLELKEKLFFAWDKAKLEDESFPILDDVVRALNDNKNFRVQVEGHTDSTGANGHNQTLSEARAAAVLEYLVSHGIPKDRLVSKGFASSIPTDSNETVGGRENNRRVEFMVNFIIQPPRSGQ